VPGRNTEAAEPQKEQESVLSRMIGLGRMGLGLMPVINATGREWGDPADHQDFPSGALSVLNTMSQKRASAALQVVIGVFGGEHASTSPEGETFKASRLPS